MNRLFSCLAVFVLAAAVTTTGTSQNGPIRQGQTSRTDSSTAGKEADYSREPYIYEYIHESMRYETSGQGVREAKVRARVNSAAGLSRMGQLVFEYNAANEELEIRSVRVLKPDGSVITAGADAVQDLTAPVAREAPMYTDARQKHVTVPGLAVGDAIEYDVVGTVKPLLPGQFWHTWNFNDDTICLDEEVELNVPADRALKIKSPVGVGPVVREEAGRRIYHWTTSTTHYPDPGDMFRKLKFNASELLQGVHPPVPRQIIFSTLQSWEDVGRWYEGLERDRRTVTPEVRSQADAIVHGLHDEHEKAQALYQWVSRNIRYVSLSFGVGRYQPHAAAEVLIHRYGDCKDKTTLLEAFLEAEGLRSQAALINSRMEVDPDVPSPAQFDHAITYLKLDGQETWLDSTLGVGPFRYLLPQLRGKRSLVVFTTSAPELKKTPQELPIPTLYRFAIKGTVDKNGRMDGVLSLDVRGDAEVLLRLGIMTLPPGQLTAMLEKATAGQKSKHNGFSMSDLKTDDVTDTSKPFHAELRITDNDAGKDGWDTLSAHDLNDSVRRIWNTNAIDSLLPEVARDRSQDKSGEKPLQLGGPREYSLEISMTVPSADHAAKPESIHMTRDFAEYESATRWDDRTFHGLWRLAVRVPEVSGKQLNEYASFRKELQDKVVTETVAKSMKPFKGGLLVSPRKPGGASAQAAHVRPPEAETFYEQALAEIKLRNWGNAEQKLEAALKLDPQDKNSWNELGRSRMYLRKYDAAEAAFRKLMEIAPEDHLSIAQMSWVLGTEKKYDEAAQILEKRVAAAPEDGDAYHRLGFVYIATRHFDKAVPALEKATSILPKNASAHFLLGRAYLQTHKGKQGAAEFERGLAIQTNDAVLNDAAYELAVAGTSLDLAESWALQAVHDVEVELNQTVAENIQPRTFGFAVRAGMYWDTLGWIKFQKKDLAAAEKYTRSAWELMNLSTEGYHLGRIYEAQNRKEDAIEIYAEALALGSASQSQPREPSDDEKDTRARLVALLGGDSAMDARIAQSRSRMKERRSMDVENAAKLEGIAEYVIVVGPDGKIIDLRPTSQQNGMDELAAALRAATAPLSFPDSDITRLPLNGTLACPRADQPCKFNLMSAGAASRTVLPSSSESLD